MMLDNERALKRHFGQDPDVWFPKRGFDYKNDLIGFNIRCQRHDTHERFDYPFHSDAIKEVMDRMEHEC